MITLRRRTLLGGLGSMVMLAPLAGCRPWLKRNEHAEVGTPHQRATIAAMAESFLPAADGSPGAADCGAADLILDPAFPIAGYVSELVGDLDDWCFVRHGGRAFVGLAADERERALEERMGLRGRLIRSWYLPVYEGVLVLTKLAFFGGLRRTAGMTFVGFPGPSAGYAASSAAGIHAARRGAAVTVEGAGKVSIARVTALLGGVSAGGVALRLIAPDGTAHPIATDAESPAADANADRSPVAAAKAALPGTVAADRAPAASTAGTTAAGAWRLDAGSAAVVTAWWLELRTDLDEAAAAIRRPG